MAARRKELRELVENSQSQLDELRKLQQNSEEAATAALNELGATRKELDRALPFEKEVKEKNLLIGKLRHEAVILNDHLTKALRFLKQRRPEDMVDRELVTNHLLHFLTLDRTDPKKFQVLQLIAALLAWNDGKCAPRLLISNFITNEFCRAKGASWTSTARCFKLRWWHNTPITYDTFSSNA